MATEVYETGYVELVDGTLVYLTPLKIKYLRQFMVYFSEVYNAKDDHEVLDILSRSAVIAMQQYYPDLANQEAFENAVDMAGIYKILKIAADINIDEKKDNTLKDQAEGEGSKWEDLDLASLEAEVFLIGIWKDYEELEESLSMPEIIATLNSKRDLDYQEKKFLAAIQGVDLDKQSGKSEQNGWEQMKARVFSGGKTSDPNDIISFQGTKAAQQGFGIGMGLDYVDMTKKP